MKKQRETAVNSTAMTGGEWEQIAPYGDHPTANRKKLQRFYRPQAEAMVAEFNSLWSRLGNAFRGMPVFHGHPDVDPENWPDDRRLGKIVALEAREDGLYGKAEWNALGQQNMDEGWWVYPSPAWLHPKTTGGVVTPDELLSVGLVNTPNILGSVPWTNSTAGGDNDETDDTEMKEKLCALLGLDPATATDDQVIEGVTALQTSANAKAEADTKAANADTARADALKKMGEANSAKAAVETKLRNVITSCATVLVGNAISAGKLTEAEKEATTNSFLADGADIEKLAKDLDGKKAELNTGKLDLGGGRTIAINDARSRQDAIQAEVNSRQAGGLTYDQAYKAVKRDPKFKPLFEAMKKPGEDAA
jgi:hypothetical protein